MTEDKARKSSIRTRMAKTGESYTAARRNVSSPKQVPKAAPSIDLGKSDEAVKKGSGKTWDEWLAILDSWGGKTQTHTEIARHIKEDHGVPSWWAQTVTVGYERARGIRKVNEGSDGFSVSVSRTFPFGVNKLFSAFADPKKQARWLEPGTLRTRTSQPDKSARFDFKDGTSRVHVYFTSKGESRATVTIQHERLADQHAVAEMRAFWKEQLDQLRI